MVAAVDFWTRKRQELQAKGELPQARTEPTRVGTWWDEEGHITGTKATPEPVNYYDPKESYSLATGLLDSSRDFSKATHLKSKAGDCPNCGSGDYVKPSALVVARCWNCGYTEGRVTNDLDTFVAMPDARTLSVRQLDGAHGIKLGSRPDKNEMAYMNAQLEASASGKAMV